MKNEIISMELSLVASLIYCSNTVKKYIVVNSNTGHH